MISPANNLLEVAAAARLANVRYAIRDLAELADEVARQGKEILPLNIGDPLQFDFRTPPHLVEAVVRALRDGLSSYAPSLGVPEAVAATLAAAESQGIRNIQSVFMTAGVSEAVDVCFAALLNPGENVLTPVPEYPLYSAVLAKVHAQANPYILDEANDWEPDPECMATRISSATRALLVINPNNPTGAVYSRHTLEAIAELARQNNLLIFADEEYDKLVLDDGRRHTSIAALAPDLPVVTFNGLSKGYLAPGWRVGWVLVSGPEERVKPYIGAVHQLLRARLCSSHPHQYAVRPALEGPQDHLEEVRQKLRSRRDLTMEWCDATPRVSCVKPRSGFYAFPRLEIPDNDEDFVRDLLVEKQVFVVHGSGFGQVSGTRHFRIVFLPEEPTLARAYGRITDFIRERYR
jgi:alanine-synthesizing transaminase